LYTVGSLDVLKIPVGDADVALLRTIGVPTTDDKKREEKTTR
jgi:hypothetical protein